MFSIAIMCFFKGTILQWRSQYAFLPLFYIMVRTHLCLKIGKCYKLFYSLIKDSVVSTITRCVEPMYGGVKCHRIFNFFNIIFTNSHL